MTLSARHCLNRTYQANLGIVSALGIVLSFGASGTIGAESTLAPTLANEMVFNFAKQWVAENEGLRADEVQFLPIDERLDLKHCSANNLELDLPFGSNKTLRLRCGQGNQQVFLHRSDSTKSRAKEKVSAHYENLIPRSESLYEQRPTATVASSALRDKTPTTKAGVSEQSVLVAISPLMANQPLDASLFRIEKRELFGNSRQFVQSPSELPFLDLLRPLDPVRFSNKGIPERHALSVREPPFSFSWFQTQACAFKLSSRPWKTGFLETKFA